MGESPPWLCGLLPGVARGRLLASLLFGNARAMAFGVAFTVRAFDIIPRRPALVAVAREHAIHSFAIERREGVE
jgi:hypothetical protein